MLRRTSILILVLYLMVIQTMIHSFHAHPCFCPTEEASLYSVAATQGQAGTCGSCCSHHHDGHSPAVPQRDESAPEDDSSEHCPETCQACVYLAHLKNAAFLSSGFFLILQTLQPVDVASAFLIPENLLLVFYVRGPPMDA